MIENFNNITILESYISSYPAIVYIMTIIAIIALVIIMVCVITLPDIRIKNGKIVSCIYIICLICQIYKLIAHTWLHPPIDYKIIFHDEMTATEYLDFVDQFQIIEQNGEIYTVRLRE